MFAASLVEPSSLNCLRNEPLQADATVLDLHRGADVDLNPQQTLCDAFLGIEIFDFTHQDTVDVVSHELAFGDDSASVPALLLDGCLQPLPSAEFSHDLGFGIGLEYYLLAAVGEEGSPKLQ